MGRSFGLRLCLSWRSNTFSSRLLLNLSDRLLSFLRLLSLLRHVSDSTFRLSHDRSFSRSHRLFRPCGLMFFLTTTNAALFFWCNALRLDRSLHGLRGAAVSAFVFHSELLTMTTIGRSLDAHPTWQVRPE